MSADSSQINRIETAVESLTKLVRSMDQRVSSIDERLTNLTTAVSEMDIKLRATKEDSARTLVKVNESFFDLFDRWDRTFLIHKLRQGSVSRDYARDRTNYDNILFLIMKGLYASGRTMSWQGETVDVPEIDVLDGPNVDEDWLEKNLRLPSVNAFSIFTTPDVPEKGIMSSNCNGNMSGIGFKVAPISAATMNRMLLDRLDDLAEDVAWIKANKVSVADSAKKIEQDVINTVIVRASEINGGEFSPINLEDAAAGMEGFPLESFKAHRQRYLTKWINEGRIEKVSRGVYRIVEDE